MRDVVERLLERLLLVAVTAGIGLAMGFGIVSGPASAAAETILRYQNGRNGPSLTESISSGVKKGVDGFTEMITPKPKVVSEEDPVALSTEAKPSAQLYLAVAHLFEQSGKLVEAQKQYQSALEHEPTNLAALLGYARLKDRLGQPELAGQLYLKAAKAHPTDPSVHNNLALLHARQGRLEDAVIALQEAVRLQPRVAKYRNNIATILVEMGRSDEALSHLRAVHSEPVANYNLAYLLEKRGNTSAALRYYAVSLSADPSLAPARQGVDRLARVLNQASQASPPVVAQGGRDPRGRAGSMPVLPPGGPTPHAAPGPSSVATPSRMAPRNTAPPSTPPSPPMVNLPQAPRAPALGSQQVVLPEPSVAEAPSTVASPSARPHLEPPAEPAVGSRASLPQVRLLPPPPPGYQSQVPLPKAAGMRSGQTLPSVTVPRRLPPTLQSRPVDPRSSDAAAPLPSNETDGPALQHLPPVQ